MPDHNDLSRREFLRRGLIAGAGAIAGLPLLERAAGQAQAARPNIVFFLIDDLRYDAMGIAGHPDWLKTPNIDRIGREGAWFQNAFVTLSLCCPSRASFLTGMYAHSHGVYTNEGIELPREVTTFPQLLQQSGYRTAFVGKWHMGHTAGPRPGFDYWLSFLGQGVYENPKLNENGRDFQAEGYMTDLLTDYAVKWLKQPSDKPFCLLLWHKAVHGPFTPAERHRNAFPDAEFPEPKSFRDDYSGKPEWQRRRQAFSGKKGFCGEFARTPAPEKLEPRTWEPRAEGRLNYYRTLLAVDDSVGQVCAALEQLGVMDNTIIIFAGDNGFFMGEHRGLGDKRMAYEESIRIPLLMRYPKLIPAGSKPNEPFLNIDVGPTLLSLAGVPIPKTMQGDPSYALELQGVHFDRPLRRFLYEYFREEWLPSIPLMLGVRGDRWKYVTYPDLHDIDELYDLQNDPIEMHNLAQDPKHADTLQQMRKELERLKEETRYPEGKQLGAPALTVTQRPNRPEQLVLAFDFARRAGKAADASGKGHDGTLKGTTFVADGRKTALRFDGAASVSVEHSATLDPSLGPWTVEAVVKPEGADGVILSQGGSNHGYVLYLKDRKPRFAIRVLETVTEVSGEKPLAKGWARVTAVIGNDGALKLYLDGKLIGSQPEAGFLCSNPVEGLELGADSGTRVSPDAPGSFKGLMRSVSIWAGERRQE